MSNGTTIQARRRVNKSRPQSLAKLFKPKGPTYYSLSSRGARTSFLALQNELTSSYFALLSNLASYRVEFLNQVLQRLEINHRNMGQSCFSFPGRCEPCFLSGSIHGSVDWGQSLPSGTRLSHHLCIFTNHKPLFMSRILSFWYIFQHSPHKNLSIFVKNDIKTESFFPKIVTFTSFSLTFPSVYGSSCSIIHPIGD